MISASSSHFEKNLKTWCPGQLITSDHRPANCPCSRITLRAKGSTSYMVQGAMHSSECMSSRQGLKSDLLAGEVDFSENLAEIRVPARACNSLGRLLSLENA